MAEFKSKLLAGSSKSIKRGASDTSDTMVPQITFRDSFSLLKNTYNEKLKTFLEIEALVTASNDEVTAISRVETQWRGLADELQVILEQVPHSKHEASFGFFVGNILGTEVSKVSEGHL